MKSSGKIPQLALGMLIAFPVGYWSGAERHQMMLNIPIFILMFSLAFDGIREQGISPLFRIIPYASSGLVGIWVLHLIMNGLLAIHNPPFVSTLNLAPYHLDVTFAFWFFAVARSFIRTKRPYATVISAFIIVFTLGWFAPFDFLGDSSVVHTSLLLYGILSLRMIYVDLAVVGLDLGQKNKSNKSVQTSPTSRPV